MRHPGGTGIMRPTATPILSQHTFTDHKHIVEVEILAFALGAV